eukprot:TRINITY_DN2769_c0_g1_i4.p1 TRINITY_DN2769_c0_g1~~TRINITY_DN2769_c0_g1_i4.p1  ORF type:complete len:533 (-),score=151.70 TRINITY_DN2769_c0_g1_i4:100-1698(-)
MNNTLAGYFFKIITNFLNKRPTELMDFFMQSEKYTEQMVNHVKSRSISEILLKFLSTDTNPPYFEQKMRIVERLLSKFNEKADIEELANISFILSEMIGKSKESKANHYLNSDFLNDVFETVVSENATLVQYGANVILSLLNLVKDSVLDKGETQANLYKESLFKRKMDEALPKFCEQLVREKSPTNLKATHGLTLANFGNEKLRIIEIFKNLLTLEDNELNEKIADSNFFQILLFCMKQSDWNNILHNYVEQIFRIAIECGNDNLKKRIIEDVRLPEFIITTISSPDITLPSVGQRTIRKGYLGQVIRLANFLAKLTEKDQTISDLLTSNEAWIDFSNSRLIQINKRDNFDLGGARKLSIDETDRVQRYDDDRDRVVNTFVTTDLNLSRDYTSTARREGLDEEEEIEEDVNQDGDNNFEEEEEHSDPRKQIERLGESGKHQVQIHFTHRKEENGLENGDSEVADKSKKQQDDEEEESNGKEQEDAPVPALVIHHKEEVKVELASDKPSFNYYDDHFFWKPSYELSVEDLSY